MTAAPIFPTQFANGDSEAGFFVDELRREQLAQIPRLGALTYRQAIGDRVRRLVQTTHSHDDGFADKMIRQQLANARHARRLAAIDLDEALYARIGRLGRLQPIFE